MKERVILNKKEQKRLVVLNQVEMGKMRGWEAAEVLGLSLRHVRRVLAAYRKEGAAALAHGNRGRRPHNALDEGLKEQVVGPQRFRKYPTIHDKIMDMLSETLITLCWELYEQGIPKSHIARKLSKHRETRRKYEESGGSSAPDIMCSKCLGHAKPGWTYYSPEADTASCQQHRPYNARSECPVGPPIGEWEFL